MAVFPMIARRPFSHRGTPVEPGTRIDCTALEAAVYAHKQRATFAPKTPARPGKAVLPKAPPTPAVSQRRDIEPEPSPPSASAPDVLMRRASKRRDVVPEGE